MPDTIPSLDEIFDLLALRPGDTVHFSSDIGCFWDVYSKHHDDFSPIKILQLLQERVTEAGTLILPTYSWDFCHGLGFDIRKTQPRTGALNKLALRTPGFRRTKHPIYSYAVWGKDSELYLGLDNTDGWGDDSPLRYMHQKNAVLIQFCVSAMDSMTICHYVEKVIGVPYRFEKFFTGDYTDEDGTTTERTYSMYCKYLDYVPDFTPEELEAEFGGDVAEVEIGGFAQPLRKMRAKPVYDMVYSGIQEKIKKYAASDTPRYTVRDA